MPPPLSDTAPELFSALPRESTLAQRVAREMESLVTGGQLRPGDRLPAERELARQFGVSRTVVREAVSQLTARGLLHAAHGSGTVIQAPGVETVSRSMSLYLRSGKAELDYSQVHEVRRLLEVEIAGLAAERRTQQDLAALDAILEAMPGMLADQEQFTRIDVEFHAALARATHNCLFPLLLDSVVDVMRQVRQLGWTVPGAAESGLHHHTSILERVRAGDVPGARRAMEAHLEASEEIQRRVLEPETECTP